MQSRWLIPVAVLSGSVALAQPVASKEKPPSEAGKPDTVDPTERPDRDPSTEPPPPPPPVAPPPAPAPVVPEAPLTADDVSAAPPPGEEHGRLDPLDEGDSVGRTIGRGVLWIPRLPIEAVFQPVRGVLYIKDKYNAVQFITDIFTTDDRKIAIFPTALIETGFGLNVGARATFTDVLGEGERLKLRAGTGGRWSRIAVVELETGKLVDGPISLGMEFRYEKKNNERFFGYGNVTETRVLPATPVDPTMEGLAVDTRYQIAVARVAPRVRVQLADSLAATFTGAFMHRDTQDDPGELSSGDVGIGRAYDTSMIPGFGDPAQYVYTELELSYDTRRAGDIYDPSGMRTAGGLLSIFGGRENSLSDSAVSYYRAGIDVQRVIRIFGQRTLQLRAYGEAVSGEREQLPFFGLTRLGGEYLLRGYARDRFRDTAAAVAQASYVFPLNQALAASLFVDAGRVFDGLDNLSVEDPRVGFGGALEVYGSKSMVIRAELASSIDGGVFGYISLDPAFDAQARVERR